MTPEEIKKWCKTNKVTQAQLAEKIGYSHGMLAQALNGHETLSDRMYKAILLVVKEHAEPITVKIPDEVKEEIIKQANALRQNVDEFLHNFLAKTLGIDYLQKKGDKYTASEGYSQDETEKDLEAGEEATSS